MIGAFLYSKEFNSSSLKYIILSIFGIICIILEISEDNQKKIKDILKNEDEKYMLINQKIKTMKSKDKISKYDSFI